MQYGAPLTEGGMSPRTGDRGDCKFRNRQNYYQSVGAGLRTRPFTGVIFTPLLFYLYYLSFGSYSSFILVLLRPQNHHNQPRRHHPQYPPESEQLIRIDFISSRI